MKFIKTDDGAIVTETKSANLNLARGRAFLVDNPPAGATELDPVEVGSKVAALGNEISGQLISMTEATHLLGLGLLSCSRLPPLCRCARVSDEGYSLPSLLSILSSVR